MEMCASVNMSNDSKKTLLEVFFIGAADKLVQCRPVGSVSNLLAVYNGFHLFIHHLFRT